MIDTLAERVLCIVASRLADIARMDYYATDAGLRVLRARRTLDVAELPALVLWDDGEQAADAAGSNQSMAITLNLTVDAHVTADQDCTGAMLERIRADVKRACLIDRGALADQRGAIGVLTYTGTDTQARSDGACSESVAVHFIANYKEAYGDPTTAR
ncbi:MAG: hypothetical protein L0H70_05615 [Xanthomonadales bacterium]|nr:hypothetical protein [Xanthomonadales bacterium]